MSSRTSYERRPDVADPARSASSQHGNGMSSRTPAPKNTSRWGTSSVELYEKIDQVGQGTYGEVWKAREIATGNLVALKRVRMDKEKEGFPITAIREIKILKELRHDNIVNLLQIVTDEDAKGIPEKGGIYMVFEFMDHDLAGLKEYAQRFSAAQIKCYFRQLLKGLQYCHMNNVLHRDLKLSNILVNNQGQLKLADFGLARPYKEDIGNYTNRVITIWYRPPELLLGATKYGPSADMWSAGCILGELLLRKPLFPGKQELDELHLIYSICGTPDDASWPDAPSMPYYNVMQPKEGFSRRIEHVFRQFPKQAVELVDNLLLLDPAKRLTARQALDADYFWVEPLPAKPQDLPHYPSSHEFTAKKRKASSTPSSTSSTANHGKQPAAKYRK